MSDNIFDLPPCPPCPSCHAAADAPCLTEAGRVAHPPHAARIRDKHLRWKFGAIWIRQESKRMNRPISEAVSRGDRPTVTVAEQAPSPAAGRTQSNGVLTSGKTIQYINRWKALEGRRKELDYDVSKWCHDVRAEFPAGSAGDDMLRSWVDTELDLAANRREEILTRAAAFAALPDRAHYEGLGGFKHVRGLLDLTKREQVAAIGEAKASGSTLGPVVRARLHAKMDRHYRRYRAAHPVPVMMSFDLRHTPQENEAWTRAAAGQKLEDWVRSVCNAAAKVKRK